MSGHKQFRRCATSAEASREASDALEEDVTLGQGSTHLGRSEAVEAARLLEHGSGQEVRRDVESALESATEHSTQQSKLDALLIVWVSEGERVSG